MAPDLTFLNAAVYHNGTPVNFTNPSGSPLFTAGLPRDSFIGPNFEFTALPEPGTWATLVFGLAALAVRRRRS